MGLPVIVYRNILASASLTASGTASEFTLTDLRDRRSFTVWKAAATTSPQWIQGDVGVGGMDADCLLVVNHNGVANAGQIKVYADTVDPPVAVAQAAYTPTSDAVEYKAFTLLTAKRYWRVEFSDPAAPFTAAPFAGEILLGKRITLTEYVNADIDPFLKHKAFRTQNNDSGHYLGGIKQGVRRRGVLHFGGDAGVARSLYTSDLNDFIDNHAEERFPFGFVYDPDDTDFDTPIWVRVPDDGQVDRMPVGGTTARFFVSLPIMEAQMDQA